LDADPGKALVEYVEDDLGMLVIWLTSEGFFSGPKSAPRLPGLGPLCCPREDRAPRQTTPGKICERPPPGSHARGRSTSAYPAPSTKECALDPFVSRRHWIVKIFSVIA